MDSPATFPPPSPDGRVVTPPATRPNTRRQRFAMLLGSGMVLAFFSEFFFLNEGPVESVLDTSNTPSLLLGCLELGLWYSLFAAWLLIPIHVFNLRSIWGVFFAAALFGWAVEGVVIPYIYAGLPFSLLWPSMSWHVFVDVFLGWWLVRQVLQRNSYPWTIGLAITLGLAWGLWATWLHESEFGLLSSTEFTRFAFVTSTMWIVGNVLIDRFGGTTFRPTRREMIGVGVLSAGSWLLVTIAFTPLQLVFPLLIWLVVRILRRAPAEPGPNLIESLSGRIGWTHHLVMLLTPAVAALTYRWSLELGVTVEAWIVAWPLLIAGLVMAVRGYRRLRPETPEVVPAG